MKSFRETSYKVQDARLPPNLHGLLRQKIA